MSEAQNNSYRLQIIRGIPQNPTFDPARYEEIIDTFETNDGDCFIATYVKAGTTWTQQMIHLLVRKGVPGGFYSETVPWLEALSSPILAAREAPNWTIDKLNSISQPRYFKTHATVDQLPRGLAEIKVIYIARNPKDTVVSLYHHARSKPEFGYTGTFEAFVRLFLEGKVENGSWFDHVLSWHKECMAQSETHLFLMYEDIYEQPMLAVQLFAALLELRSTDDVYESVVRHSALQEMQATASIGMNHLRRGGIGGWRDHFTVALSEQFDDVYKARMAGSELRFNFGKNSQGKEVYM